MAIFHLHIKVMSRGRGGKSAVAAAAYRAGESIKSERNGITYDYTRRGGVIHTEILLPEYAPADYAKRAVLWNEVEKIEKAKNSQLAREVQFALPVELTREQNIALARAFIQEHFVDKGMCADLCIHDDGGGNPHAHVMLTMRPILEDGTWGDKQKKEYVLDSNGDKIYDPKKRQYKCNTVKTTDWNDSGKAEEWRAAWDAALNAELEKRGHSARVDHRSFERQGIEQVPTIHLGVVAMQMERRGLRSERGNYNRAAEVTNKELRQLRARIRYVKEWLYSVPIVNAPTMIDMIQGVASGRSLDTHWKRIADLKLRAKVLIFLSENGIRDVEQLAATVEWMHTRQYEVSNRIKEIDRRKEKLTEHLACKFRFGKTPFAVK